MVFWLAVLSVLLLMVPPVEIELLTFEVCLTLAMMRQLFTHWKFVFKHFHQMNWKNAVMLMLFCMMVDPVGGVNPNMQQDYHTLPGMRVWNGKPYADFRITWFAALMVALGSIFQTDWTLLQVARDQDEGGPGNPAGGNAAAQAAAAQKSANRNLRLFHSIMNYISPQCALYRQVSTHFAGDGRGLYNFLWTFGHRGDTRTQAVKKEAKWKDASIASLHIPYDDDTIFTWKEWVVINGDKLGKTLAEKRAKFLDGLPSQLEILVIQERNSAANGGNGTFVHPAIYPAHFPAALAGNAHPDAGNPDMSAMSDHWTTIWIDMMSSGAIKAPPKGSTVLQCETEQGEMDIAAGGDTGDKEICGSTSFWDVFSTETRTPNPRANSHIGTAFQCVMGTLMAVSRDSINKDTICYSCGGRGHVSKVDGVECSTLRLGIQVPKTSLEGTTYPDGITFPIRKQAARPPRNLKVRVTTPTRRPGPTPKRGAARAAIEEPPTAPEAHPAEQADPSQSSEDEYMANTTTLAVDLGGIQI